MNGRPRIATLSVLLGTLLLLLTFASSTFASPVSSKKAQLRQVQAKLQTVYQQADVAVEKYNQATSQLATVQAQIKENEHLLKVAEYNLEIANEQLSARAESIYKTRDVGVVDVIFAASSFDDLVTQLDVMERLGNSDVDTVKSIAAYRLDIKDRRVKLGADKKAAAKLVASASAHKAEVEGLQSKLERMTAGIRADIKRLQAAAGCRSAGRSGGRAAAGCEQRFQRWWRRRPSSTRAAPATPPSSASPSATSACPTCTAAPVRAASTAPASRCTATRRSASASRTAPPPSSSPAHRCR